MGLIRHGLCNVCVQQAACVIMPARFTMSCVAARSLLTCVHVDVQVQFPERQGALRRFLDVVSPRWNVTLFHYRNTGNRESYVLLGLQVSSCSTTASLSSALG